MYNFVCVLLRKHRLREMRVRLHNTVLRVLYYYIQY